VNRIWRFGAAALAFSCGTAWVSKAAGDVTLVEKDGWEMFTNGRINAFASYGNGDGFPTSTTHEVVGGAGYSTMQSDTSNHYSAMRIRSGFVSNVFGFGFKKQIAEGTTLRGYLGLWTTVETFDRNKWLIVNPDAREGYVKIDGPWGGVLVGRSLGLFGRGSTQVNYDFAHGYGLGFPCDDKLGPTCGHIGTGVMFPGFAAGFVYNTPSLAGLQLSVGIYDPVQLLGAWERTPYLRPEAALTYDAPLGENAKFRAWVEGVYQPLARQKLEQVTDPDGTMRDVLSDPTTVAKGVAGGLRGEVGPVRLGVAAFHGPGLGLYYALQNSPANFNAVTKELRTFDGFYAQSALVFGPVRISAGAGVARVHLMASEKDVTTYSVPKQQIGISGGLYYNITDHLILAGEYFRFRAEWYLGESQTLHFVNAGLTATW